MQHSVGVEVEVEVEVEVDGKDGDEEKERSSRSVAAVTVTAPSDGGGGGSGGVKMEMAVVSSSAAKVEAVGVSMADDGQHRGNEPSAKTVWASSASSAPKPIEVVSGYILDDAESVEIEGENLWSLLLATMLLAAKRQFECLSHCLLRSVNERQIECSRWYKYALSLYGQRSLSECQRACRRALQSEAAMEGQAADHGLGQKQTESARIRNRRHFVLSATLLASRSAVALDDAKWALTFGRAAVRLSLESVAAERADGSLGFGVGVDPDDDAAARLLVVDERATAYLLLSMGCSLSAATAQSGLSSFVDRKALHKLAMKAAMRATILAPRNQSIVLQLAQCRADLGDADGALDDVRSLLHRLHPLHSESWHLLSLLLSAKRRWMASYRAIDQAIRFCDFRWGTVSGHFGGDHLQSETERGRADRGGDGDGDILNDRHSFYRHKLVMTKIKILMAQQRVSWPLALFLDLLKTNALGFDHRIYKMAKLPNSNKLAPLFLTAPSGHSGKHSEAVPDTEYHRHCLLKLRLEFVMTLTAFYLRPNVAANKFAFHSMEFALHFFGAEPAMKGRPHSMAAIYSKMGECAESLGQSSLALAHYKTATSIHAAHYGALCGQAAIYLLNGDLMESKAALDAALKINAFDHRAWAIAAHLQQEQGLFDHAANSHLTACELQRDQPVEPYSSVPRCIL